MLYSNCTNRINTVSTLRKTLMKGDIMFSIDAKNHEPIYLQIEKQILKLIQHGVYPANSPLPSVRAMACDLGINPNTVARAYKELELQNVIYTIVGKGVFVSENNKGYIKSLALDGVKQIISNAKSSGITKNEIIDLINKEWGEEND